MNQPNIRTQNTQTPQVLQLPQKKAEQHFPDIQFQEPLNPELENPIYLDYNPVIPRKQYHAYKYVTGSHYILPQIQIIKPLVHQGMAPPKYKVHRQALKKSIIDGLTKNLSSPIIIIVIVVLFFVFIKAQRNSTFKKTKANYSERYARGSRTSIGKNKKGVGSNKTSSPSYNGMKNIAYKGQWQDSDSQEQGNALQDQIYENYR